MEGLSFLFSIIVSIGFLILNLVLLLLLKLGLKDFITLVKVFNLCAIGEKESVILVFFLLNLIHLLLQILYVPNFFSKTKRLLWVAFLVIILYLTFVCPEVLSKHGVILGGTIIALVTSLTILLDPLVDAHYLIHLVLIPDLVFCKLLQLICCSKKTIIYEIWSVLKRLVNLLNWDWL